MKKSIFTLSFIVIVHFALAQSFSSFINYVNTLPESERQTAVDNFMAVITPSGIPYINTDTANFIFQGAANTAAVAGDFNNWNPESTPLDNIVGTNFWYASKVFELNARLDYKIVLNGNNWILDPLNPHQVSGGYGPNSELAMPDYVQPWEIEEISGTPSGTIESFSISSSNTGSTFQVRVYLPYNYDPDRPDTYDAAYFQDGFEYITLGSADVVLDNLIFAGILDTIIAVFVKPNNRNEEYAGNMRNQYRMFFVNELVPYIDGNYNTRQDPEGRAVCGDSYGGNISALISYNHPEIFGNCGLHSGAFGPNNYEAYNLIVDGPVKEIKWASIWGTYESLYVNMRELRDFLLANDYELSWQELPEGHSWGLWRATIDELLPFFFPGENLNIPESGLQSISELKVLPNPFLQSASIVFHLSGKSDVHVSVFDQQGRLAHTRHCGFLTKGIQVVQLELDDLKPGLYFCTVTADSDSTSIKMVKR